MGSFFLCLIQTTSAPTALPCDKDKKRKKEDETQGAGAAMGGTEGAGAAVGGTVSPTLPAPALARTVIYTCIYIYI